MVSLEKVLQQHGLAALLGPSANWQILSFRISETVISANGTVTVQVTTAPKAAENAGFPPRRTSDFRH